MTLQNSIIITEPQRGKDLLTKTNEAFVGNETLVHIAPVLTDGLVFVYPVLLVVLYLVGTMPEKGEMRYGALYIASAAAVATFVNVTIQFVVDKQRPEGYIDNPELLIMDHVPTAPFPSDHAAVSAAVAVAVILRSLHAGYTKLAIFGVFLLLGGMVMSLSRVGVGIHRPTDILVGFFLGALVAWVLHGYIYDDTIIRRLFSGVISIQESIWKMLGINS